MQPGTYSLGYIMNRQASMSVFDPATGSIIRTFTGSSRAVSTGPTPDMVISPDGTTIYQTDGNVLGLTWIDVINVLTGVVTQRTPLISPSAGNLRCLALSLDGSQLFVTDSINNCVDVIATATMTQTASFATTANPTGIVSTTIAGNTYYLVCTTAGTQLYANGVLQHTFGGGSPGSAILTSNGIFAVVTNFTLNSISVYNLSTFATPTAGLGIGVGPNGLALSADGSKVYAVNTTDNTVTVLSLSAAGVLAVLSTIPLPLVTPASGSPNAISVSPDGLHAYVTNMNTPTSVTIVSLATNAVVGSIPVGTAQPAGGVLFATTLVPAGSPSVLAQVPSDYKWNVTVTLSATTVGSGTFTIISGQRTIGTAVIGSTVGPFTAFPGEIIAVQVTQAPNGYTATITGTSYSRDESKPPVYQSSPGFG